MFLSSPMALKKTGLSSGLSTRRQFEAFMGLSSLSLRWGISVTLPNLLEKINHPINRNWYVFALTDYHSLFSKKKKTIIHYFMPNFPSSHTITIDLIFLAGVDWNLQLDSNWWSMVVEKYDCKKRRKKKEKKP